MIHIYRTTIMMFMHSLHLHIFVIFYIKYISEVRMKLDKWITVESLQFLKKLLAKKFIKTNIGESFPYLLNSLAFVGKILPYCCQ